MALLTSSAPLAAAFRVTVFVIVEELCELYGGIRRVSVSSFREGKGWRVCGALVRSLSLIHI